MTDDATHGTGEPPTGRGATSVAAVLVALALATVALASLATAAPALAVGAGAVPAATATQDVGPDALDSPPNVTYEVVVEPRSPERARVDVQVSYTARSNAELQRASNGSLRPEWFRGEAVVEDALAARAGGGTVERTFRSSWVRGDTETVGVRYGAVLGNLSRDDGVLVLGPGFAAALDDGDEVRIALSHVRWDDWTVDAAEPATTTESEDVYAWTVGDGPEPRVEFDRSDYDYGEDGDDGALALPAVLPLVALLAAGALLGWSRRRA